MDIENISETDLMNALGDLGSSTSSIPKKEPEVDKITKDDIKEEKSSFLSEGVNISSESIESLIPLLKELLNNKTLEISIKIKD